MTKLPQDAAEVLARIQAERESRRLAVSELTVSPGSDLESSIAAIWAEVLGLREVAPDANIFSLGGDSIHMVQIASRVLERYDVEITFGQFFDGPTVAELAKLIEEEIKYRNKEAAGPVNSRQVT